MRPQAQVAAHVLPDFGYAPDQIATITALILATRLPQRPRSPLQEILCDADLDVLGREDFLVCNRRLRAEQAQYHFPVSDVQWYQGQLTFLEEHLYVTPAAQALRDAEKRRNILHLQALLAAALDDVSQTGPPRLLQSESV